MHVYVPAHCLGVHIYPFSKEVAFHSISISPSGGNFILGCGDAVLIVEVNSVAELTDVRCAIILHGAPFVHMASYKPASVVIYLNLEGAALLSWLI